MNGKTGETRRMLIASCFLLLSLGGVFGATYCAGKSLVILGHEEWLKAGLYFVAATLLIIAASWTWKRLGHYRPQDRIPAKLRARLKDQRSTPEKFTSSLIAYSGILLLFGAALALFFVVFPRVAAQPLGERVQFLAMSGTLAAVFGYILFDWYRTLAGYVPDDEPASLPEAPPSPGWVRRTVTAIAGLTFAAVGVAALVFGCLQVTMVWSIPALGIFDFMLATCMMLGGGLLILYMAWSILKELWRPTRAHSAATTEA